jgi:hypothetical protein
VEMRPSAELRDVVWTETRDHSIEQGTASIHPATWYVYGARRSISQRPSVCNR